MKSKIKQKNVIITGATGMVGGLALRMCLDNPDVSGVTAVGRSRVGIDDPKLQEAIVDEFNDYTTVMDVFEGQDAALFCLGVYTGAVPDDLFRKITVDYTVAFAKALYQASFRAAFCLLSGQGADQTGKSRMAFARYKGEAETALLEIGFPRVHLFRPGYIFPVTPRKEPNFMYRISRTLYPVLRRVYPNIGVTSEKLARVMVHTGLYGSGNHESPVLENKTIRCMEGR